MYFATLNSKYLTCTLNECQQLSLWAVNFVILPRVQIKIRSLEKICWERERQKKRSNQLMQSQVNLSANLSKVHLLWKTFINNSIKKHANFIFSYFHEANLLSLPSFGIIKLHPLQFNFILLPLPNRPGQMMGYIGQWSKNLKVFDSSGDICTRIHSGQTLTVVQFKEKIFHCYFARASLSN